MPPPTPFTNDDVEQILRVVDQLSNVEVRLESGDLKLHVRKFSSGVLSSDAPSHLEAQQEKGLVDAYPHAAGAEPANALASGASPLEIPADAIAILAPTPGTFYRAPSPTDTPFVDVGTHIRSTDPVCIIEVMKLFNTVNAGVEGTIIAVVAENGAIVEQDEVLFLVRAD